jgi:dTDP-4-dehydrorhamnose 3,5-epimerase
MAKSEIKCDIDGVIIRHLDKKSDNRGWLMELYRHDELTTQYQPAMSYLSLTKPGVTRGPHEHRSQSDLICFVGSTEFALYLWDNRPKSLTYGTHNKIEINRDTNIAVTIPARVVHAYKNTGTDDGIVINCPNRLYGNMGRVGPIDEIRHEDDPGSEFKIED